MGAPRKHSKEMIQSVLVAWRGGLDYKVLGERFDMNKQAMGSLIRRYMTDEDREKVAKGKTAQPEMIQEIMGLWRLGLVQRRIAKEVGYSEGVVAGIISRHKRNDETVSKIRDVKYSSFHQKKDSGGLGIMKLESSRKTTPSIFTGIRFGKCQWIPGEPSRDERCKCRVKTGEGRIYCPRHEAEAVREKVEA